VPLAAASRGGGRRTRLQLSHGATQRRPLEAQGRPLAAQGLPLLAQGQLLGAQGRPLEAHQQQQLSICRALFEASRWAFQDADIIKLNNATPSLRVFLTRLTRIVTFLLWKSQILDESHLGGGNLEDHSPRIAVVLHEMIGNVRISGNGSASVKPNPVFPLKKTSSSFWLNFLTEKWLQRTFHLWQVLKIHIFPNQCLSTTPPFLCHHQWWFITSKLSSNLSSSLPNWRPKINNHASVEVSYQNWSKHRSNCPLWNYTCSTRSYSCAPESLTSSDF